MNLQKEINGIIYISVPEKRKFSCEGCTCYDLASGMTDITCHSLAESDCSANNIIWIKKDDKQIPLDKAVHLALEFFYNDDSFYNQERMEVEQDFRKFIDEVFEEENRLNDPEYKKYLELKKKFG